MKSVFHILIKSVLLIQIFESANGQISHSFGSQLFDPDSIVRDINHKRVQYQPRHVHLAYGDFSGSIIVTWSTIDNPNASLVEFGQKNIGENLVYGLNEEFISPGPLNLTQYIHSVTLRDLEPGVIYIYHCGSNLGWSELFYFRTVKSMDTKFSPQLAIYGDLGNVNAKTLTRLQRETQLQYYDAIVHVGDFAYDLHDDNGLVGDAFMDQIQPIAAYVPYMVCPGNHESFGLALTLPNSTTSSFTFKVENFVPSDFESIIYYNSYNSRRFLHYKKRFRMPGNFDSMTYSWNLGPIHFISFSTEYYYFGGYEKELAAQFNWLAKDLDEANDPQNRDSRPWIITYGHRPVYCSNLGKEDCGTNYCRLRDGIIDTQTGLRQYGIEDLFMSYGVDLSIWAHMHSYERLWPTYNHTVRNGSIEEPYKNPNALVHVTTGSAGCDELHDLFPSTPPPDWSAFRSTDYGFSRLKVFNRTHLYMEQISEDQDGRVIDSFFLIRENHEPYRYNYL